MGWVETPMKIAVFVQSTGRVTWLLTGILYSPKDWRALVTDNYSGFHGTLLDMIFGQRRYQILKFVTFVLPRDMTLVQKRSFYKSFNSIKRHRWKYIRITAPCHFNPGTTEQPLDPSVYISMQDCSNSIANDLELLQSCTKPSIYFPHRPVNWRNCCDPIRKQHTEIANIRI